MMADFCGTAWRTLSHEGVHGPVHEVHFCELRPKHRGDHACGCPERAIALDESIDWVGPDLITDYSVPTASRRFVLDRVEDPSGVSGLGIVAEGVEFTDGSVAVRWLGDRPSTAAWGSIEDVEVIHGHGGKTRIRWADEVDEP